MLNDTLPGISQIKLYTVKDLVLELEENDSTNLQRSSMSFQTCIYICDLISKSSNFKSQQYSEFKDLEPSGINLGGRSVSNGALTIYSVACESGLVLLENDDGNTVYELKKILDSLDPDDTVDKKLGAYLRKFIERCLIKNFQKSGQVQVSDRLYTRFKEELKKGPFIVTPTFSYKIKEEKFCEPFFNTDVYLQVKDFPNPEDKYRKIVNYVPLWFGTNNVMETKEIKQLLIDAVCSSGEVNLNDLFIVVKEKVKDWLVNSPLSIEHNSDTSGDSDYSLKNTLKSDNIFENNSNYFIIEDESKKLLNKFSEEEIYFLKLKFLEGKTFEEISSLIGKSTSTVGEKSKKLIAKLEKEINKIIQQNDKDFDKEELVGTFMNEIRYMRLIPEKL